ncbi:Panacea domain-containing protein [Halalkalibacterium halodurans]|uniref:Panacea domain-containing protein n=1 Tax=Halalkalibacterium halodurans TaxID=86665 RepID=UPI002AA99EF8|nr:type II toxin-antitoxin system antitoxin SocA domain-containing protein [Halalkalibacterium halodurans]MDY7223744.1 DUF4065 domain-containing protein [Halalkalibacterium halodurans]MDY7242965.1 DUF4065 domain-containing protein [Halalkalibacterium halodurans]
MNIMKNVEIEVYTAQEVADFFLSRNVPETNREITPLKLQKLVYYAQAWHLVEFDEPLFDEKIEAWDHGPVIPDLYFNYRHYKYNVIDEIPKDIKISSERQRKLLEQVWKVYGKFDGKFLEHLTHKEDPWKKAYTPNKNNEITLTSIADYYGKM